MISEVWLRREGTEAQTHRHRHTGSIHNKEIHPNITVQCYETRENYRTTEKENLQEPGIHESGKKRRQISGHKNRVPSSH